MDEFATGTGVVRLLQRWSERQKSSIAGENSSGTVAAFELIVPGAQRLAAPAHSHDHYEETIYGIDGVLTWTVDGKQIDVGPGQALCIPRGAIHRFDNNGNQDAKALCVITPAAIGPQYFRDSAEVISAAVGRIRALLFADEFWAHEKVPYAGITACQLISAVASNL